MPQLSVEDYHIGWVCALPSEMAAAKAMLDERHEVRFKKGFNDSNSYALGRVHDHNVVVACLPDAIDGTNAAAVAAVNMLRTFKAIKFGLLVGIGGGIPDLKKCRDIRLGDIVVGEPTGENGGVVQHDKGKILADGNFQRKGQMIGPPTVLLTALANLKSDHLMEDSRVQEYLNLMISRYPKMRNKGFSFPECQADILRCASDHPGSASCEECNDGRIERAPRSSHEPQIHYGIIASGNQVIKNATVRDHIRDTCHAICIEMEAAGLMNDFRCLIIRGICDYADAAKNNSWHNYAAATAAAFAKELLFYVSAEETVSERPMAQIIGLVTEHLKNSHEHFSRQEKHSELQHEFNQQAANNELQK